LDLGRRVQLVLIITFSQVQGGYRVMAQNAVFYSSTMTLFLLPWLIPARGTFSLAVDEAMSYAEIF